MNWKELWEEMDDTYDSILEKETKKISQSSFKYAIKEAVEGLLPENPYIESIHGHFSKNTWDAFREETKANLKEFMGEK